MGKQTDRRKRAYRYHRGDRSRAPTEDQTLTPQEVHASTKVLNTVELLELILLDLPVRDLLLVQQVCCP